MTNTAFVIVCINCVFGIVSQKYIKAEVFVSSKINVSKSIKNINNSIFLKHSNIRIRASSSYAAGTFVDFKQEMGTLGGPAPWKFAQYPGEING